jgi:hypothetical protein
MSTPLVARFYRSVLRFLPAHVGQQDRSDMVDALSQMWWDAHGPRRRGRVIRAAILGFPRLWIAEWWDAMTDPYAGAPFGIPHATRLSPLPVRVRPLTLALVVCAIASRFLSVDALFFSSASEFAVQVTAFLGGLAFFVMVACSNAASLLKPRAEC